MIAGLHVGSNFRKFGHGKLPPLALVMIMLLPLLFGGLFVWSYYDPLGNMNKMPVALVNEDQGQHGQTVVDALLEERPLDFHVVSAQEAREGIADGTYYLGVEIPEDFSAAAESVRSPHPHQAQLHVALNETNGFIPTMLGNQATSIMSAVISDTVSKEVVNQLFVGFNTINDGMHRAADGAGQLNEGAERANEGAGQLGTGAGELNDGARTLDGGLQRLSAGAQELDAGIGALQQGAGELGVGIGDASRGARTLADGLSTLQGGTAQLGAGAAAVSGGVDKLTGLSAQLDGARQAYAAVDATLANVIAQLDASGLPGTAELAQQARGVRGQLNSSQFAALTPQLIRDLNALREGARTLSYQLNDPGAEYRAGVEQAAAGAQALAQGLALLEDGAGTLVVGVGKLKDGSSQLVVGARTAASGSSRLAQGSDQLVAGLGALGEGLIQLSDGSGQLSLQLAQGAEQAPRWDGARLDAATDAAGSPVTRTTVGDEMTFFGKGLSPFFLSLSLWIGGLMLFMIFKPLHRRAIDSGANPARVLLTTLLPALLVGAVQASLLWLVQVVVIGVAPAYPLRLFAVLVFGSWVFMSAITAINVVCGAAAGRLVTMVLMSLQLVASNGLYPPEVQPRFIQWVHVVDPMRFTVDLLRHALFGSHVGDPRLWQGVLALGVLAVVSWVVAGWGLWRERVVALKDLHPELSI